MIEVWNKIDRLSREELTERIGEVARRDDVVMVSAIDGRGVDGLERALAEALLVETQVHRLEVPVEDGAALAWLHAHGEVIDERHGDAAVDVEVRLSDLAWRRFNARGR